MHLTDVVRQTDQRDWFTILLDGRVVGRVPDNLALDMVTKLRYLKAKGLQNVSVFMFPIYILAIALV